MLDRLRREDFVDLIDRPLPMTVGAASVVATVVEARVLKSPSPRAEPFSLVVRVPSDTPVVQGMHTLVHPVHGALALFFVPIARDANGVRYEAVFN